MRRVKKEVILCQDCACYRAFYRKGSFDFWKEQKGICSERKKIVNEKDTCAFGRPPYPIVNVTIRALDKATEHLEAIKEFFDGDSEEPF